MRQRKAFRESIYEGPVEQDTPRRADGAGGGTDADKLDGQDGLYYLARANHTGAQAISTVTGLQTALDAKLDDSQALAFGLTLLGTVDLAAAKIALAYVKADVGLGSVDNTFDVDKPVSTAQQTALDLKAPLSSPALTDNPTAPTQLASDDSTKLATTAFVKASLAVLTSGASTAYDTFLELQALMEADDTAFTALTSTVAGKLQKDQNLSDLADAATARGNLGLGTLATQSGTFSGTSSGTNTGDQTAIAGITGTKAQFDTAVTDGNIVYTDAIGVSVQAYDADLDAVAASGIAGAWSTTTPTPTSGSGAFTTVSGNVRALKIGKTVRFSATVTITTNGTAASYIDIALPFASVSSGFNQSFGGREVAATGISCGATLLNNSTTLRIQRYDGTYLGANGYALNVNGTYEAA